MTEDSGWKEIPMRIREVTPESIYSAIVSALQDGSLKLPLSSKSDYTKVMINFFENLGRKWGYGVRPEYLTIDCPWFLNLQDKEVLASAL